MIDVVEYVTFDTQAETTYIFGENVYDGSLCLELSDCYTMLSFWLGASAEDI